jgi:hypothetical protein
MTSGQTIAIHTIGTGTPYSLMATIKSERKLADGNTISGVITSRQFRDSEGRTRMEAPLNCSAGKDHEPVWEGGIQVADPIAKVQIDWNEWTFPKKVATITHREVSTPSPPTPQQHLQIAKRRVETYDHAAPDARRHIEQVQVEDLGRRTIMGLAASGMRITRTQPPGMAGNSLPLIFVEEIWQSDDFGVYLLNITEDPIFGKSTYEVTSFTRDEPDASLFQPPADYEVKTQ